MNDDLFSTKGLNIGNYAPGSVAYVKFSAKVNAKEELPCGPSTLKNVARVETNNGWKQDDADVVVAGKECQPDVGYRCEAIGITTVSKTEFRFTITTSAENATFKNATFVVRNASGAEIERKTVNGKSFEYKQIVPGTYTVQAIVTFTVNGQDKTVTSTNCQTTFTIPGNPETPPELPETGPAESIVAILGLGAVIASVAYYIASRRALNQ